MAFYPGSHQEGRRKADLPQGKSEGGRKVHQLRSGPCRWYRHHARNRQVERQGRRYQGHSGTVPRNHP